MSSCNSGNSNFSCHYNCLVISLIPFLYVLAKNLFFIIIVLDYLENLNVPCPQAFPNIDHDLNAI